MMLTAGAESGFHHTNDAHRRSLWAAVIAGLFAAVTLAVLLCRPPDTHLSQLLVVLVAGFYLFAAAIFGGAGSYLYWLRSRAHSSRAISPLLRSTLSGWFWIPAVVLLFRKDSALAPAIAATGAAVLAYALRREGPAALTPDRPQDPDPAAPHPVLPSPALFSQSLRTTPVEWTGAIVAVCVGAELYVLLHGWLFAGCAFLAVAAFVFAWARTPANLAGRLSLSAIHPSQLRSAIPALIVTTLAMLVGAGHDLNLWAMDAGLGGAKPPQTQSASAIGSPSGHVSLILLTAPKKQQIVAPHPAQSLLQSDRLKETLVIQFDGEYWYFQQPYTEPGPGAFTVRQSPLLANIHSVLAAPLLMQAHQRLASPLPLSCCHHIEVEIESRDQTAGALNVALSISNSASPQNPTLLGMQPILSSQGALWRARSSPAHETLRFDLPAQYQKNTSYQFDQIDMLIVPDPERAHAGAKIAIRTLKLVP